MYPAVHIPICSTECATEFATDLISESLFEFSVQQTLQLNLNSEPPFETISTQPQHTPFTLLRFSKATHNHAGSLVAHSPQHEHVVPSQIVNVLCALQQHQLGQDGHCLQVDGEGPQDLHAWKQHLL